MKAGADLFVCLLFYDPVNTSKVMSNRSANVLTVPGQAYTFLAVSPVNSQLSFLDQRIGENGLRNYLLYCYLWSGLEHSVVSLSLEHSVVSLSLEQYVVSLSLEHSVVLLSLEYSVVSLSLEQFCCFVIYRTFCCFVISRTSCCFVISLLWLWMNSFKVTQNVRNVIFSTQTLM